MPGRKYHGMLNIEPSDICTVVQCSIRVISLYSFHVVKLKLSHFTENVLIHIVWLEEQADRQSMKIFHDLQRRK
jgi:hypothetical protein